MFKKLKLIIAARRVKKNAARTAAKKEKAKLTKWGRVRNVISWPFRIIGRGFKKLWKWIRCIDLIGLINLTLLISIIVLFSMLILDIMKYRKNTVVVVTPGIISQSVQKTAEPRQIEVIEPKVQTITLPLNQNHAIIDKTKKACVLNGNVMIDGDFPDTKLSSGTQINGNLYLQNMRRYTLPCNVNVDGDLFLRNVDMLRFCGSFTVTGNIYVSHNSSFGPIPRDARLGGQVIF